MIRQKQGETRYSFSIFDYNKYIREPNMSVSISSFNRQDICHELITLFDNAFCMSDPLFDEDQ